MRIKDSELLYAIEMETTRQHNNIELIASENFVSDDVMNVTGSILTNKYAEGYPGARYYGGCEYVDIVEDLARNRLCELYGAEHANVQPHSGSQANMAVYLAVLKPNDKVLGMDLSAGGHLTHGHKLSSSGILYDFYSYGVDSETEEIDYEVVRQRAHEVQPKLIVAGASAYSRIIDFKKFREIADEVGALLMVDMAHIAGPIAAGLHPSPVEYADFVTSTTHKTLRGPRGGIILCKEKYAKAIDRSVFPGVQGGPLMHVIAGKAVCFYEALQPEFKIYQKNVLDNCKAMTNALIEEGFRVISKTTDNHLVMIDVYGKTGLTGKEAEEILGKVNITCNKNSIPFDTLPPTKGSGIRLGSAAMTTKGYNIEDFRHIGKLISKVLNDTSEGNLEYVRNEVKKLVEKER